MLLNRGYRQNGSRFGRRNIKKCLRRPLPITRKGLWENPSSLRRRLQHLRDQ